MEREGPACGVCREPLQPGDHVALGHGHLVHVNCEPGWGDLGERALELLMEHGDAAHCHRCLAAALGTSYEPLRKAVTGLRATRDVVVRVAKCSQCDKPRVTVRLAFPGTPARPAADDHVRHNIKERLRTGRLPGLGPTPQRAGQTDVKIFTGRGAGKLCSVCDAMIQAMDRSAVEFASPPGRVTRFHLECFRAWKEEARRLLRGV